MMHLDPRHIDRTRSALCDEAMCELDVLIAPCAVKALVKATDTTSRV
jgi:hypothetical protein